MGRQESGSAVEVAVVPVVVRFKGDLDDWLQGVVPDGGRNPALLAYVEEDGWASDPLPSGTEPRTAARGVVRRLAPRLFEAAALPQPEPEPVGFLEPASAGGPVLLVYTVAGPVSATELPPPEGRRWIDLHGDPAEIPDGPAVRDLVREHWRQSLEETTRGLDLLPRYFTMSQLLDVYRAVWNDPDLDWSNFQDWATERNDGMVRPVSREEVARARDAALRSAAGGAAALGLVAGARASRSALAGTSVAGLAVPAAALAGPVAMAIAAAAGGIAHQRRARGKPPTWYTRAHAHGTRPRQLKELFLPRPSWVRSEL